jgi:valyl-tRNA synthetase
MASMKLNKAYDPSAFEPDIYTLWEKSGAFTANPDSKAEKFSISMPPPNETGTLSIGHALFITLQDIMARHARQQGKDVLWLPGTDHAALPVNAIIEKQLADEGTDKHAIGREAFLEKTKEFVAGSRGTMIEQMRAMGASADWSRQRYTLDGALNRSVNETFVKMFNDGLIYRGHRIVNWDPNLETTISDDEIERVDETTSFYTFKYGPFEISTARPETKFGDKYVVMHPDDERYKDYKHGQTFEAEWINGPVLATVLKDTAVDPAFGTGVMTITPWHDHTDFEIAERHDLEKEQIIDFKGNLLPIAKEFAGMHITEARPKIVAKLKEKGLLVKVDDNYQHNVAVNERGKGVIEPQIKLQWFVDVNKPVVEWEGKKRSLKEVMQHVVREKMIDIVPSRFEKVYFNWIDNLRDWCISRQIWWGHRIPAWYRQTENGLETYAGMQPPTDDGSAGWHEWEQDPDTLDTWFSSALWTWSTLIDPELAENMDIPFEELLKQSKDYQAYHPTSVMETGWDILFFWVARMILMTTYMTGDIPFKTVYLHGMVRAEDGKKMSKSRPESIINPVDVINQYGTDALRMALITSVSPGNDQSWNSSRVEANRNFCNKLWNIARFVEGILEDKPGKPGTKAITPADHWMLRELQQNVDTVSGHIEKLRFSEGYSAMYHFVWDSFADWYIEASKREINPELLRYGLETILKMVHPFAPFVTETIWQTLEWTGETVLMSQPWPAKASFDDKQADIFEEIKTIVAEVRIIKSSLQLRNANLYFTDVPFLKDHAALITGLAGINSVQEVEAGQGLHLTQTTHNCWLDVDKETMDQYATKLQKQLSEAENKLEGLEKRLGNKAYVKQAPKKLVEETKQSVEEQKLLIENTKKEIARFSS